MTATMETSNNTSTVTKTVSRRSSGMLAAMAQPTILVAEKLGAGGVSMLEEGSKVEIALGMTPAELLERVSQVDALIIRSGTQVTREVFEAAKGRLKVVGRAGVGIDNVDLAAASEHGCLVVNAPTANTVAAAEHAISLITSLARHVAAADASMKAGRWERNKLVGVSVAGKTLSVFGFGKVGAEVAKRARGLGMTVLTHDPYVTEERARAQGAKLVTFDEALAAGDFLSLHMPLLPSTRHVFNDAAFAKCKKGARLVNVARGAVVDDEALVRALDAGVVAGAALDVFDVEPPPRDNPLVCRPDVIATPHLGASTAEAQEEVAYEIAEAVLAALRGELTPQLVNAPAVSPEVLAELAPHLALAAGLGRAATQLVDRKGFGEVRVAYHTARGSALDTRLLRANVLRGVLEATTDARVNIVNADLLARKRGLRVVETVVAAEGEGALAMLEVSLDSRAARFSAAVDAQGRICVAGAVKGDAPFLTRIGGFDVDLAMEGDVLLVRQTDRPGIIAGVASELAENDINISFMTVGRQGKGGEAIMAIGVDAAPDVKLLDAIKALPGVYETTAFSEA